MAKRIGWIDISKGIGIVLVILGHTGLPAVGMKWIYSFHMPLFFLLSGLVFDRSKYKNIGAFLFKKAKSLLIPYVCFSCVVTLSYAYMHKTDLNTGIQDIFLGYGGVKGNALWFLPVLFFIESIYFLLTALKPYVLGGLILLCAVIGYILSDAQVILPYKMECWGTAIVFLFCGHLGKQWLKEFQNYFLILVFLIINIAAAFINPVRADMNHNVMGNIFCYYIAAFSGILFLISVSKLIEVKSPSVSSFWIYLGSSSLIILGLHQTIPKLLQYQFESFYNLKGIVLFIIQKVISFIVLLLCIPLINRFLPFFVGKQYASKKESIADVNR